jgi:hypothetical protein
VRKILTLLLLVSIVFAPVANTLAASLGGSGEHVHFDHVWHAVDHHDVAHHNGDHNDADHYNAGRQNDAGGPLKHAHIDFVHCAAFLAASETALYCPAPQRDLAMPKVSFPAKQIPHPPFRPPQAA